MFEDNLDHPNEKEMAKKMQEALEKVMMPKVQLIPEQMVEIGKHIQKVFDGLGDSIDLFRGVCCNITRLTDSLPEIERDGAAIKVLWRVRINYLGLRSDMYQLVYKTWVDEKDSVRSRIILETDNGRDALGNTRWISTSEVPFTLVEDFARSMERERAYELITEKHINIVDDLIKELERVKVYYTEHPIQEGDGYFLRSALSIAQSLKTLLSCSNSNSKLPTKIIRDAEDEDNG